MGTNAITISRLAVHYLISAFSSLSPEKYGIDNSCLLINMIKSLIMHNEKSS